MSSSSWPALRAQLFRSTTTLSLQRNFRATCDLEPGLKGFADPVALFDYMHRRLGDPDVRNAILAALVRRAQAGSEAAVTLILLALWPGLDAAYGRLLRHFAGASDVLAAEICGHVIEGIHRLDLGLVHRIAATLIRNCERDILRGRWRHWSAVAGLRGGLDPEDTTASEPSVLGLPPGLDADEQVVRLVDLMIPMIGGDAHLVVAIAVLGDRQEDAAADLGLGHDAGRKRYQRALRKLQTSFEKISDPLSQSRAAVGLYPAGAFRATNQR